MTCQICWTSASQRALEQLPEKVAVACVEFIYSRLTENPYRVGKPLRFELEGIYDARRGDYRILYTIEVAAETVTIIALQHRADVYRPQ